MPSSEGSVDGRAHRSRNLFGSTCRGVAVGGSAGRPGDTVRVDGNARVDDPPMSTPITTSVPFPPGSWRSSPGSGSVMPSPRAHVITLTGCTWKAPSFRPGAWVPMNRPTSGCPILRSPAGGQGRTVSGVSRWPRSFRVRLPWSVNSWPTASPCLPGIRWLPTRRSAMRSTRACVRSRTCSTRWGRCIIASTASSVVRSPMIGSSRRPSSMATRAPRRRSHGVDDVGRRSTHARHRCHRRTGDGRRILPARRSPRSGERRRRPHG